MGHSICEIPKEVPRYGLPIGKGQPGASGECDNKVLSVVTMPPKRRGEFVVFECWRAGSRRPAVAPGIIGVGTKHIDPKTVKCEILGED